MGANLLRNFASKDICGVGISRSASTVDAFAQQYAKDHPLLDTAKDYQEFLSKLERPRKVFVLVPSGKATEAVLTDLSQRLETGDVVVECGNSFYADTQAREQRLTANGLRYIGCGVSGGEEGALKGPSMMPGGDKTAYEELAPLLKRVAAQGEHGACVAYMGPGGAGHYVKMVHNGIEYADMQLIAEICDVLMQAAGQQPAALADIFQRWNEGALESFLIEITAQVLRQQDSTGRPLVEMIKDSASMKGTGTWTVQDALQLGACVPTITAAVDARLMSAEFDLRQQAAQLLSGPANTGNHEQLVHQAEDALLCAKVCCYAQGMALLRRASEAFGWNLPLKEIAGIWTAGCIIRARLLGDIQGAFAQDAQLENLLLHQKFAQMVANKQLHWRSFIATALQSGRPLAAISSALAYYDALRSQRLPANIIQAQRDLFGAHTYERLDQPGHFHTEWNT